MAEPFLSELRLFSFNFAPKGWAQCNGQLLLINQNQALFSLLGTTYGGNGQTNFALPDLRGRTQVHMGNGISLGQSYGESSHTVTMQELPAHNHLMNCLSAVGTGTASNAAPGNFYVDTATLSVNVYKTGVTPSAQMAANVVSNVGGSQPHENRQPFLTLNWCIALQGIFPSQT